MCNNKVTEDILIGTSGTDYCSYFIRVPVSILMFDYKDFLKIRNLQSIFLNVMSWITNKLWTGCKAWVINIFASF